MANIEEDDKHFFKSINYSYWRNSKVVIALIKDPEKPEDANPKDAYDKLADELKEAISFARDEFTFALQNVFDLEEKKQQREQAKKMGFSFWELVLDMAFSFAGGEIASKVAKMISAKIVGKHVASGIKDTAREDVEDRLKNRVSTAVAGISATTKREALRQLDKKKLSAFAEALDKLKTEYDIIKNYLFDNFQQFSREILTLTKIRRVDGRLTRTPASVVYFMADYFNSLKRVKFEADIIEYLRRYEELVKILEYPPKMISRGPWNSAGKGRINKGAIDIRGIPEILSRLQWQGSTITIGIGAVLYNTKVGISEKKPYSETGIRVGSQTLMQVNVLAESIDKEPYDVFQAGKREKEYELGVFKKGKALYLYQHTETSKYDFKDYLFYEDVVIKVDGKELVIFIGRITDKDMILLRSFAEKYYRNVDTWFWKNERRHNRGRLDKTWYQMKKVEQISSSTHKIIGSIK